MYDKAYIDENEDPLTSNELRWKLDGIESRWREHSTGITVRGVYYKAMFVLAVITDEWISQDLKDIHEGKRSLNNLKEQVALSLEASLISHYIFHEPSKRSATLGHLLVVSQQIHTQVMQSISV